MVLNMQLWRKPLLLYYFVLSLRNIAQVPLITPFLSRWNIPKPDVCLVFTFCFICFCFLRVLFGFFIFFYFVQALHSFTPPVLILTAQFVHFKGLQRPLSLKTNHKVYCTYFVYVRCLNKL